MTYHIDILGNKQSEAYLKEKIEKEAKKKEEESRYRSDHANPYYEEKRYSQDVDYLNRLLKNIRKQLG